MQYCHSPVDVYKRQAVYRREIINFISSCFYAIPLKRTASKGGKADFFKEQAEPFFCRRIRPKGCRLLYHVRLSLFLEKGQKMSFSVHLMRKEMDAFLKLGISAPPFWYKMCIRDRCWISAS